MADNRGLYRLVKGSRGFGVRYDMSMQALEEHTAVPVASP
jgi:hypothetical protein